MWFSDRRLDFCRLKNRLFRAARVRRWSESENMSCPCWEQPRARVGRPHSINAHVISSHSCICRLSSRLSLSFYLFHCDRRTCASATALRTCVPAHRPCSSATRRSRRSSDWHLREIERRVPSPIKSSTLTWRGTSIQCEVRAIFGNAMRIRRLFYPYMFWKRMSDKSKFYRCNMRK